MIEMKGRRVNTPDGDGEVLNTIGDKAEIKLDTGEVKTYAIDDISEDSSAG